MYNNRHESPGGGPPNPDQKDYPTAQNIIEQAVNETRTFFGREVTVPQPPQLLLDTVEFMQTHDMMHFEALYIPPITLGEEDDYPGWHTKIGTIEAIIEVKPEPGVKIAPGVKKETKKVVYPVNRQLPGIWVLFDTTPRQPYSDIRKPAWDNDPLSNILIEIPKERLIELPAGVKENSEEDLGAPLPHASRFGLSMPEQEKVFLKLAEKLKLEEQVVNGTVHIRRPTLAEFNYMGNLRHPELGGANTWEFMDDSFVTENYRYTVTGGSSEFGGLAHASYILDYYKTDARGDAIGFRTVIAFSNAA